MPMIMDMEAIRVPKGVRVFRRLRMGSGMTKQNKNIPQKYGANLPINFDQKMVI